MIKRGYRELRTHIDDIFLEEDCKTVDRAFKFASEKLEGVTLPDGQPTLEHSIGVAVIAAKEMGLAVHSVVSAILHNIPFVDEIPDSSDGSDVADGFEDFNGNDNYVTYATLEELFGKTVRDILEGLQKINSIDKETLALHSENFRRLLLTLSGDVRVILIKLADQLQDMRNLQFFDGERKISFVSETEHLYAPFAHRLGLYKINSELQDIVLSVQHSEEYNIIKTKLEESNEFRHNFTTQFVKPIEEKLEAAGWKFTIKARTKSIYSIWNKMKSNQIDFTDVHDIFAIRVILETAPTHEKEKADCWQIFSIVTEQYKSNPNRHRDWLSIRKSNGYESLHTTVLGPYNKWVEVQIRTERMNDIAENGMAAHWRYKGGDGSAELDNWLQSVREILENPSTDPLDFMDCFKTDVYNDEIFAFTPNGDLQRLTVGATLLDFAYAIHSKLGDSCVGGTVNGKHVKLDYKLSNGDTVSIDKSNSQKPKLDWLEFVVSSKARNRIKSSLNDETKIEAAQGKEILQRKLKNWKIPYNDKVVQQLISHFKFKQSLDLYYQIATGKIDPLVIKEVLKPAEQDDDNSARSLLAATLSNKDVKSLTFSGGNDDYLVIDNSLTNVNYKLSQCCNPVSGDKIFGFVTISDGIKIHRNSCPNAPQMRERYPYRIVKTAWRGFSETMEKKISFKTSLLISGRNSDNLLVEITLAITKDLGVRIISINADTKPDGTFECYTSVSVYGVDHLENLMSRIKSVKGVETVVRTDGAYTN